MKTNQEIITSIVESFDNLKVNHLAIESINVDDIENHIELYAELTDIFNDVTITKRGKYLHITIYKTPFDKK